MALFGLFGGKKTSVGLDIGSGIIKLVVIDHGGSEAELTKVATTEVAADAIVEGEVMDPGLVSEAIRGLFEAAGVKRKSVVTAVGGRDVIVKKIHMDQMKEGDAREVIRWEAEQHVPFDMANVELDFQILDPDAEGLQMNVLLVAAKRELVDSRTSLLGEAGLEAGIIDVDAFAIHNAFELNHPDAMQGVVGLVNIGHEVTNVNILEDGVPVLTRDLSVGTRRFREDLQREKGMASEEAERVILGRSLKAALVLFAGEPFFPLQVLAEAPRPDREISRQHGNAVLEDVHIGHFVADVDETHDALHRVGVIQLEGVVDGEGEIGR